MHTNSYLIAGGLALSLIATGCTTDPYTGERQGSRTGYGAAIGAATAGALGYFIASDKGRHNKRNTALIAAGVGALAGGAVGNYMDRQESKVRQQLQGTGVSVTRVGDNLILNMPGNITFAFGRDEINSNFYPVLNSVVLVLKEYDKTQIEVAGHTDSVGSDEANLALSQRRAGSVANYLSSQGVAPIRIQTIGYGEARPLASNDTDQGREANRRVELVLIPIVQG